MPNFRDDARETAYWSMAALGLTVNRQTLEIQPSGADHQLQSDLKMILDEAKKLENSARAIRARARSMAIARVSEVARVDTHAIELSSFYKCDASPTGYCAYDLASSHGTDECLFCGQPDERK